MNLAVIKRPELFFGIVGPVGTDLKTVVECLAEELRRVSYNVEVLRLSHLLASTPKFRHLKNLDRGPEDKRINAYMTAGDKLRELFGLGDAVVRLAIANTREYRFGKNDTGDQVPATAFILNSLKHPDELATLRQLYGDQFFAISIYSPRAERKRALKGSIARSRGSTNPTNFESHAEQLIDRDEEEVDNALGQNVRETFPEADYFIKAGKRTSISQQLQRFVHLIFGHPFITPTRDEYAMFHAKAAAFRSADLSRQVGAVIATGDAEIIASGCNEVPHQGGGSAWEPNSGDDTKATDYRDFQIGRDPTVLMKQQMVSEIVEAFKKHKWLAKAKTKKSTNALVDLAIFNGRESILRNLRVANIIEFGRIVHAEMAAITDAARRGVSTRDNALFCTTFPCHMCARHIVISGIRRVVYVEPYPKSLAKELYDRTIQVDGDTADDDAVRFEPFIGVAPRRYADFFAMPKRKDGRGYKVNWSPSTATPRLDQTLATYLDVEKSHVDFLLSQSSILGIKVDKTPRKKT